MKIVTIKFQSFHRRSKVERNWLNLEANPKSTEFSLLHLGLPILKDHMMKWIYQDYHGSHLDGNYKDYHHHHVKLLIIDNKVIPGWNYSTILEARIFLIVFCFICTSVTFVFFGI